MNCRVCNTRVSPGAINCLNCGNPVGPNALSSGETQVGAAGLPSPTASNARLPEAVLPDEEREEKPLEEAVDLATPVTPVEPVQRAGDSRAAPLRPDRVGLRELLAQRPDQLDSGLSLYEDDAGRPVGQAMASPVGEIDILARDGSGALVVVMIAGQEDAAVLVSEILQRMGWVRKHLAGGGSAVRGIVLIDQAPASLSYAAAAVADTVAFMTWRIALSFEPVEL